MRRVIILRGVPGSGKTTLAKRQYDGACIVSADDYYMRNGVYRFDPALLSMAHADCLRRFVALLSDGCSCDRVVVDNTNTTVAEIAPYYALAIAFGLNPLIVTLIVDPIIAAARNVHGVSTEACIAMNKRIERETPHFPQWWRHEEVHP